MQWVQDNLEVKKETVLFLYFGVSYILEQLLMRFHCKLNEVLEAKGHVSVQGTNSAVPFQKAPDT